MSTNLLTRSLPKPNAPAKNIDEIIAERAKKLDSAAYRIARLHESQGGDKLTPADKALLAWEQDSKARLDALSKQQEAQHEADLVSERFKPAATIQRGGHVYEWELETAALEHPALRKNRARQILAEAFRPGTEVNRIYTDESHPEHGNMVRAIGHMTALSNEPEEN